MRVASVGGINRELTRNRSYFAKMSPTTVKFLFCRDGL
jgi:hypothetical protein